MVVTIIRLRICLGQRLGSAKDIVVSSLHFLGILDAVL